MNIKITVFNVKEYDSQKDWPPSNAVEFIKWFQGKLDLIPEEYRNVASIDLETHTSYDSSEIEIDIYYDRPETAQEAAARKHKIQLQKEHERINELALLEKLKKKYGA